MVEQCMLEKLTRSLIEGISPPLPVGVCFNDADAMWVCEQVWKKLVTRIKGAVWKLTDKVLEELRLKTIFWPAKLMELCRMAMVFNRTDLTSSSHKPKEKAL